MKKRIDDQAFELALRASSHHEAARLLECHPSSIHGMIRRRGLDIPGHWPKSGRRVGSSNRPLDEMREAAAASESGADFGRRLGISRQAARELVIRHDLEIGGRKIEIGVEKA